jgi:ADP-ribose pyrophosphatase YjhB (NUDIX family)
VDDGGARAAESGRDNYEGVSLLVELAGKLWQQLPKRIRRWWLLLTESRFTVTAGAVITDQAGRVLLLKHRFRPGSGWGIPGGFFRPREQPEDALRRELREEIGLEVSDLRISFVRTLRSYNQVEIIFCCRAENPAQPRSREIIQAAWFAPDAFPLDLSDDQRSMIRQALPESVG